MKYAIEELFDVDVKKVNIMNTARKPKTMGNMRQYKGFKKSRKKAIVTLTAASADIEIFGESNDEE